MNYQEYNDNELLAYIAEKNEDANQIMYKKYQPLIEKMAKRMYQYVPNTGLELSDLIQEGMLGLSSAIETFRESKETLFYTYATNCIKRKMISMVISATRMKHKILNDSISIEATDSDGNMVNIDYLLKDDKENPEKILLNDEYKNELLKLANSHLTNFEVQVFELKINGFDYREIAEILDREPKSIDNALQRIKTKLKKFLIN